MCASWPNAQGSGAITAMLGDFGETVTVAQAAQEMNRQVHALELADKLTDNGKGGHNRLHGSRDTGSTTLPLCSKPQIALPAVELESVSKEEGC